LIRRALYEDSDEIGDVTTQATIPATVRGLARFLVKSAGVLAGLQVAEMVFQMVDNRIIVEWSRKDGDVVKVGDYFGTVRGSARSIITAERVALNLLQRMSGVATSTRRMVDAISHTKTRILDTRKTIPGLRVIDKLAVRIGGGVNHRFGLFDMVMIKDNHVTSAGGIRAALTMVQRYLAHLPSLCPVIDPPTTHSSDGTHANQKQSASKAVPPRSPTGTVSLTTIDGTPMPPRGRVMKVECETRSLEEIREVLNCIRDGLPVHRIMLDNMVALDHQGKALASSSSSSSASSSASTVDVSLLRAAMVLIRNDPAGKTVETEASGNVTIHSVRAIAETGVDFISCGSITHSAPAMDISLKIRQDDAGTSPGQRARL